MRLDMPRMRRRYGGPLYLATLALLLVLPEHVHPELVPEIEFPTPHSAGSTAFDQAAATLSGLGLDARPSPAPAPEEPRP